MADTIYIKYFKMWKCHQTLQPNAADEAVWLKQMRKVKRHKKRQIQNNFPIILLIGILSYVCARGNFEKNIMTNLVGTKPYSDQLSVWDHFTASPSSQIRTQLEQILLPAAMLENAILMHRPSSHQRIHVNTSIDALALVHSCTIFLCWLDGEI